MAQNGLDENIYEKVLKKIDKEQPLSVNDLKIIFMGLRGDDRFRGFALYVLKQEKDEKVLSWIVKSLNEHFSFLPTWDISGVSGFKINECDYMIEHQIEKFALDLYLSKDSRQTKNCQDGENQNQ